MRIRDLTSSRLFLPAVILIAVAAGAFYMLADPVEGPAAAFYPKCTLRALTGWECPGCGAQRAAHALLNGRVAEGVMYNPFLFLVIPYLLLIAVTGRMAPRGRLHMALTSPAAGWTYITLYIIWWVVRNII